MPAQSTASRNRFRQFLYFNGLSLAVTALFVLCMIGQVVTGLGEHNQKLADHGKPALSLVEYLHSGDFLEATAENWESEFLQMAFYVWLTSFLFQKGSSESRKIGEKMPVDRDPRRSRQKQSAPWPVRQGGVVLWLYEYSLSLTFALLFLVSWALHAIGGAHAYSSAQIAHGGAAISTWKYMGTHQFWFESFQNWQSEFLSLAAMVVLSIFLRHRGSPESKPVDAPYGETGD